VLTGEGSDEARRKLLANGVSRVLEKPVEPQRLLEEVRLLGALATTSLEPR
jgi:DNA-binding response OmpR family regulator